MADLILHALTQVPTVYILVNLNTQINYIVREYHHCFHILESRARDPNTYICSVH